MLLKWHLREDEVKNEDNSNYTLCISKILHSIHRII